MEIRFYREYPAAKPVLQVNEGKGWVYYTGSDLIKNPEWQGFRAAAMTENFVQETFVFIQFGLKHKYKVLPAQ